MLKLLVSLKTTTLLALLCALGLLFWVDPTTRDGDIALVLVGFLFFSLLIRLLQMPLRLLLPKPQGL